jgi:predicted hotdog family 3-hydroxylacyl-ACP dehydratase
MLSKGRKYRTTFICCQSFVNKIKTTKDEKAFALAGCFEKIYSPMAKENSKSIHTGSSDCLSHYTLEDLLPHRDAMLLIGEILNVDSMQAVTLSTVARTWPMAGQDGAPSLILVELAAQTAGVCNGWVRLQQKGADSEKMGFLVAVKRADFYVAQLSFGLQVTARAENTLAFDNFREVTSRLYHKDHLLAEVVLQLYQA